MALVWLTGVPGAGKTTVASALAELGIEALDADADGFRSWQDRITGDWVDDPGPGRRPGDWSERCWLPMRRSRVEELRVASQERVVVLAGHVPNEAECLDLLDAVVALVVDDATLTRRLIGRSGRAFGKTPEAREVVLYWNAVAREKYSTMGALVVDAMQPLPVVVEAVADAIRSVG